MSNNNSHGTRSLNVRRLRHTPQTYTRAPYKSLYRLRILPPPDKEDREVRVVYLFLLDKILEERVRGHVGQNRRCHPDDTVIKLLLELLIYRSGHSEGLVGDCKPGELDCVSSDVTRGLT